MKKMIEHLYCDRQNCEEKIMLKAKQGKITKKFKHQKNLPRGWRIVGEYLFCPICSVAFSKFMRNTKKV